MSENCCTTTTDKTNTARQNSLCRAAPLQGAEVFDEHTAGVLLNSYFCLNTSGSDLLETLFYLHFAASKSSTMTGESVRDLTNVLIDVLYSALKKKRAGEKS